MTVTVFVAVLGAAALHAGWNAVVKGGADKLAGVSAVIIGHLPFSLVALLFVPRPDPAALPWLAAGIALHLGYQLTLLSAYRVGDLTQVYPIARGASPLIVAGVSVGLLGVDLAPMELGAVGLIATGILSLILTRRAEGQRNLQAGLLALATGGFIASYSLVDGMGARAAGTGVGFYAWLSIVNGAVMAAILAWRRPGAARLLWSDRRRVLVGGGASFAAYSIVVWAFTQAPIALVTALRETSIIFALLIGVALMGERLNLGKLVSTAATLGGAVLLRAAKA